jgi:hypothetical protein
MRRPWSIRPQSPPLGLTPAGRRSRAAFFCAPRFARRRVSFRLSIESRAKIGGPRRPPEAAPHFEQSSRLIGVEAVFLLPGGPVYDASEFRESIWFRLRIGEFARRDNLEF